MFDPIPDAFCGYRMYFLKSMLKTRTYRKCQMEKGINQKPAAALRRLCIALTANDVDLLWGRIIEAVLLNAITVKRIFQ